MFSKRLVKFMFSNGNAQSSCYSKRFVDGQAVGVLNLNLPGLSRGL
jgi:hypothetical protein